ncbi:Ig-like domain-containing protein [Georgenia sp. SUBG003]|uniref:Ig-like domain-containing protein n=1 Tax=Georgenia sp. SUBG003 TaxID=1497974 RepID=UPI003AB3DDA1
MPRNRVPGHGGTTAGATSTARTTRAAERKRRTRRRIASGTVLSLVAGTVVAASLLHDGVATADVELNDGGVWVTNGSELLVGRVNYPVEQLDGSVTSASNEIDVLQEGSTVLVADSGVDLLTTLDPATVSTDAGGVTLPADHQVGLGGGVVGVLDLGSGNLRTAAVEQTGVLADDEAPPQASLGANAEMAVGKDGTAYGLSTADSAVVTVPKGTERLQAEAAEGAEPVELDEAEVGIDPADFEDADTQLTVVGDQPVVLTRTVDERLLLARPGADVVDLTDLGLDTSQVRLQHPGTAGDDVVVASADALVRVPLDGGEPVTLRAPAAGRPAAPVVVNGCVHAAWAGAESNYLQQCGDNEAVEAAVPTTADEAQLEFRTNRGLVVLNDTLAGTVYLVNESMTIVENWDDVTPPDATDELEEESQQDITDEIPLDRDAENRPPIAEDDSFGVRAGSTTIIEVLANDTDPDGDLLAVAGVEGFPAALGEVREVLGGRALQVSAPDGASGSGTFSYTVDDGRGGEATATVALRIVPDSENTAPEQLRPIRLTVTSGATGKVNVLTHMRDADGDEMLLTSATAPADDVVRFTPDGALEFVDSGVTTGAKAVPVKVSDGREETEVTVEVDVREEGNLPPVPVFDYFRATAGEEVVIEPIANDTDPDGEPLRLADVRTQGDATIVPDYDAGSFRFTAETVGAHYLTYVVVDDSGKDATGLVRVEVTEPADAAPVAVQDTALLPAGGSVLVDVLANDEDPSGRLLAVQQVTVPPESGLVVSVLEHRIVKISARQVPTGPVRFGYTVSNGDSSAEGEVVVMPVATDSALQPPVAEADTATVRAGDFVTIPVLQNDSHPAGLEFELDPELAEAPEQGKGHFFVSGETLRFRAPAQPQTVNAVYRVVDSAGNEASAQVTVHVQADADRNSAPLPDPIETRAFSGERIRIQVPLFGIDPDGDSVQLLGAGEAPQLGRVVEVGPGYLDYEAYGHLDGTDEFTYTVRDRLGMVASAPVRIGVVPPPQSNRSPDAQDDVIEVRPGREITVDVLANDTDPDGDPLYLPTGDLGVPFDPVEGVDISVENGMLKILSPEETTTFTVAYRATDNRGGQDTGLLEVRVSPDAPLLPPLARDDLVQAADIIDHDTVTVPVLENDEDPDGTAEALRVSVADAPDGVTVVDNQVQAPVLPTRQVITYQVQDVDGNVGYAFVDIPGVEDTGPVLRTDAEPIEVLTGETREIAIEDYVISPSGKAVRLTDGASVTATNSNGAEPVVDATTLSYTSAQGYAGPAAVTFEVTDGASAEDGLRSVLTLPITVLPDGGNTPPTFAGGSVEVSPAEQPVTLNLRNLVQDPDTADFNQLAYRVVEAPAGVDASIDGTILSVSAPADTPAGSEHDIVISVADPVNEPVVGTVTATVVPSTRPLAGVQDHDLGTVEQGDTQSVDVLAGAYNPFPGEPLTVVDAWVEAGDASPQSGGGTVTVTPDADFVGRVVVGFRVEDATEDPRRHVEGRVTMNVIGVPERPTPPRVEDVRDRTVVLSWTAPANNGSPITGYTVETSGSTTQCATTTCTISGLTNNVEYTFTVTATNAVGDSEPSGPSAVARPDVKPERPMPPQLTFGDGELSIEWTAPPTAGSPVESYDLMISPAVGSGQVNVSGTSHTWTGLTNGQEYRVQVRARNQAPDPSEWSGWSAGEVPAGVPDAPAAPRVQRVDDPVAQQITAAWDAPYANGDAVSQYQVQIFRDGGLFREFTTSGTSFQEDAPAGSDYTASVRAENKAGWSGYSARSQSVRSFARPSAPGTPTATATGSDGVVQLEFTNAQPNGDPITGYQVSVNGGGWQGLRADRTVRGLNDGSSYSFRVRAVNTYAGEVSGASNAAVPYGPLADPSITATRTADREITFRWSSPDGNGRAITATQIRFDGGSWQNVAASGSTTRGGAWDRVYEAEFRVVREDGAETRATARERTAQEPPPVTNPRVAVSRTRSAIGAPYGDCWHSSCAYLDARYWELPAGNYTVTFYANGTRVSGSSNGLVRRLSGDGLVQTGMFRGYPGETIRVVFDGPVRAESTLVWPNAPAG